MKPWREEDHPRDEIGRFTEKDDLFFPQNTPYAEILRIEARARLPESIPLPDEWLPRSVGAKWKNHDIRMPDGSIARFEEGTRLQDKEIFAGKGCRRKIDVEEKLIRKYGGEPGEWVKVKAKASIAWNDIVDFAEVHWYEEKSIGKVGFKFKRWI